MNKRIMGNTKSIKNIILDIFNKPGVKEKFNENLAIAYWDSVVGREISRHTDPQKVVAGTIFVKVDDATWRNELTFFKNEIIQKLNQKIGKKVINEIKFY